MGYFIGADNKHRFFSLIFSAVGQNDFIGKICVIDTKSRQFLRLLPALAIAVGLLLVIEVTAWLAPNLIALAVLSEDLTFLHLGIQIASIVCVVVEVLVVLLGWMGAVRAKEFCTKPTHVKIDWSNSIALYLIPVFAFTSNVLVLLWIKSIPEYAQTDLLFDLVLIFTAILAGSGIPRLVWLARQRHALELNWRPEA